MPRNKRNRDVEDGSDSDSDVSGEYMGRSDDEMSSEDDGEGDPEVRYCCDRKQFSTSNVIIGVLLILMIFCIIGIIFLDKDDEIRASLSGALFLIFILLIVFGCCCRSRKRSRVTPQINNTNVYHYATPRRWGRRRSRTNKKRKFKSQNSGNNSQESGSDYP
jgi:hypothetical protein